MNHAKVLIFHKNYNRPLNLCSNIIVKDLSDRQLFKIVLGAIHSYIIVMRSYSYSLTFSPLFLAVGLH